MVCTAINPLRTFPPAVGDDIRRHVAGWILGFDSTHTRDAYQRDIIDWLRFCADHDLDPLTARRPHIDAWARTLREDAKSAATVARHIAAASSWYRYLIGEDVRDDNPAKEVRRPKVSPDGTTPGLTRDELRRILAAATTPRAAALLTVLAETGLRVGELLAADVEHLEHDRGHRILRITRKGGRAGRAVLNPAASHALDTYLDGRQSGPLFLSAGGKRLRQSEVWRAIRRTARRAGIETKLSPHSLRVAFITSAHELGAALEDVQDAVGHVDPRTTRRYDRGRHNLDRHPAYTVSKWLADPAPEVMGRSVIKPSGADHVFTPGQNPLRCECGVTAAHHR